MITKASLLEKRTKPSPASKYCLSPIQKRVLIAALQEHNYGCEWLSYGRLYPQLTINLLEKFGLVRTQQLSFQLTQEGFKLARGLLRGKGV